MLITIEGTDASGKQTQSKLLLDYYQKKGAKVKLITFPDYDSESSALVKMYLGGEFGENPDDINPKAASIFFACDRYASFKTKWKQYYDEGYIIIADRYTSSNVIHQASKIKDYDERMTFIDWLYDLEYGIFAIPKPDITIFLNMPVENSLEFIKKRRNKISGGNIKDIHESNLNHLKESNENALSISRKLGWSQIDCVNAESVLKDRLTIHKEILKIIESII